MRYIYIDFLQLKIIAEKEKDEYESKSNWSISHYINGNVKKVLLLLLVYPKFIEQ